MSDPRWDTPFKIAQCVQQPDDNGFVVATMLLSNLFLLLPVAYCLYVLSFLRLHRDIHNLLEEIDPGLLRYIHTAAAPITKSIPSAPSVNQYSPIDAFHQGYRIHDPDHAKILSLVSSRYPSLPLELISSIIRWKGKDPSPLLHFSMIFCSIAGVISFIYHSCSSAGFCQLGDFVITHTMDRIYANFLVSTSILNFVERYSYSRIFGTGAVYLMATIVLEFTFPCDYISAVLNIVSGIWLIMFDIHVNKEGEMDSLDRFYIPDLVLGSSFCGTGIILYLFDEYYSYTHPPWHILAALGITAFVSGTNRDIPFAPTFTQFIKIFPWLCYDGIFSLSYRFTPRTELSLYVQGLLTYVNEVTDVLQVRVSS